MNKKAALVASVAVLVVIASLTAAYFTFFANTTDGIVCQVWSKNGPDGESFEFKVNDFNSYPSLNEGPLADLDALRVVMPNGTVHYLEKDFQAPHSYSGEGGRRWVIYGPPGYGYPPTGKYIFEFVKGDEVVRSETVRYTLYATGHVTDVSVTLQENDVQVSWVPPTDMSMANNYKVIVFSTTDWTIVASLTFDDPAVTSAVMPDVPMEQGAVYLLSVALYYEGGFSYSDDFYFQYGEDPPKPLPPE